MKNRKFAKLAVVASALSLVMCCTMLLGGGTFAWFTDSVSSEVNTIQSGNLDIVVEYKKPGDTEWKPVKGDTVLFGLQKDGTTPALWEPGYTDVVAFRVTNKGSLAVKFEASVDILEEQAGHSVINGTSFNLSDYLELESSIVQEDGVIADMLIGILLSERDWDNVDVKEAKFNEAFASSNAPAALAPNSAHVFAIKIQMPTTVGNEANHNGDGHDPYIKFGLNVVATQATVESDAFDNQYDKDATFGDPGLPVSIVTKATQWVDTPIDWGYNIGGQDNQQLDAVYVFTAKDTEATAANNPYKDWFTDFYVKVDKPVAAGEIFLGGTYGSYPWIGFVSPEDVPAETYVPLLGYMTNGGTSNWTYYEIVSMANPFTCGVAEVVDVNGNVVKELDGTTFTVELRLINPDNTDDFKVVSKTEHKF